MTKGPIIIVDDDADDQELYGDVIKNIGIHNFIRYFGDGHSALHYLSVTDEQPFIILSDVNMPQMNGLEFKENIQADDFLRQKGIPFVFISTNADAATVRKAHLLSVQGFFAKPSSIAGITMMLKNIFDYWELCRHINNV